MGLVVVEPFPEGCLGFANVLHIANIALKEINRVARVARIIPSYLYAEI